MTASVVTSFAVMKPRAIFSLAETSLSAFSWVSGINAAKRFLSLMMSAMMSAAIFSGCMGELDNQSRVYDLRILAIQVTPPEIRLEDLTLSRHDLEGKSTGDNLADFSLPVTVSVLAPQMGEDGLNSKEKSYVLTSCPSPKDGRCEGQEGEVYLAFGTFQGDEFRVDLKFGSQQLDLILAAVEQDAFHGFGGLPLTLALKVWTEDQVVYGQKKLVLQIPGLCVEGEVSNENPPPPVIVDETLTPLTFPLVISSDERDGNITLDVDPSAREKRPKYKVPTFDGGTLSVDESWTYQWFTTRGTFSPVSTGGMNPATGMPLAASTSLSLGGDASAADFGTFTAWCVLRDGRGGVSWTRFSGEFTETNTRSVATPP